MGKNRALLWIYHTHNKRSPVKINNIYYKILSLIPNRRFLVLLKTENLKSVFISCYLLGTVHYLD
jgi:hypothetical protein